MDNGRDDSMSGLFLNDWQCIDDMKRDFNISDDDLIGCKILLASYVNENYEGTAFVLFSRDGKLFEVNGGHCSCYGLSEQNYNGDTETQWQPEETSKAAIIKRLEAGHFGFEYYSGGNTFSEQLLARMESISIE